MPIPPTADVGELIRFFRKDHPEWPRKQVIAAALNTARRHGAKIPKRRKKKLYKRKR